MHKLISIAFSHYNERARWALDLAQINYRDARYMPLLHFPPVALATLGRKRSDASADRLSTRFSTPVLRIPGGQLICDSGAICRYADDQGLEGRLYRSPKAEELDARWGGRLGAHTRRLAYYHILPRLPLVRSLARANVGFIQSSLFAVLAPVGRIVLRRALAINDEAAESSLIRLHGEIAYASQLLRTSTYLAGNEFSAADLSFASLLAPVILVSAEQGYSATLPTADNAPEALAELAHEVRATPAGQHALRMYAEHRH